MKLFLRLQKIQFSIWFSLFFLFFLSMNFHPLVESQFLSVVWGCCCCCDTTFARKVLISIFLARCCQVCSPFSHVIIKGKIEKKFAWRKIQNSITLYGLVAWYSSQQFLSCYSRVLSIWTKHLMSNKRVSNAAVVSRSRAPHGLNLRISFSLGRPSAELNFCNFFSLFHCFSRHFSSLFYRREEIFVYFYFFNG